MIMLLMMMTFICSTTLMVLTHPISMGSILLLQTISITLTIGFFHTNFWYSYVLFLIMVSGMLVLFAYMTSVASNEKFFPSFKILTMITTIIFLFLIMFLSIDPYFPNLNNIFMDSINQSPMYTMSMNKYFNYPNMSIMLILIVYLLITLIAVVKITKTNLGPLRQTN